jgi:hypothetical protein
MKKNNNREGSRQQVRTLLKVIVSAVVAALVLVGSLLYYFGPSGRYLVKNALIDPSLTPTLSYNDVNHKTGGTSRFVYDGIEFVYYDERTKQQHTLSVLPETYQTLYDKIANEKSLLEVPSEILSEFVLPATLSIMVRTDSHAPWQDETKVFQKVDFAPKGGYFRIELHEQPSGNLIYFSHSDIYEEALRILQSQ